MKSSGGLMVLQSAKSTATWQHNVLRPAPRMGVSGIVEHARGVKASLRIIPVICETPRGQYNGKVRRVVLLEHKKGGGMMLPQLRYDPGDTPYLATRAGLLDELNVSPDEMQFVQSSCIVLGWYEHSIPGRRTEQIHLVGGDIPKVFIFVKVCVDDRFALRASDIMRWAWVTSLEGAERAMTNMRDAGKFMAEIEAIEVATSWPRQQKKV